MLKVLVWQFSINKKPIIESALKILDQQHDGIELVGITAETETPLVYEGKNVTFIPLSEANGGGGMMLFSSLACAKMFTIPI